MRLSWRRSHSRRRTDALTLVRAVSNDPDGAPLTPSADGTTIFTAIREQLGLVLRAERRPLPHVLAIERRNIADG